jgi:putative lipoprotein
MSDEAGQPRIVHVRVRLPGGARAPRGALLRVQVIDVSAADRPADKVADVAVPLAEGAADAAVDVPVPVGLVDRRASYSVFVHVDCNGSGEIEVGDFLSPATHPVLTRGAPDEADVPLITVG